MNTKIQKYINILKNPNFTVVKATLFFPVYEELFSKYRGKKITFVEVGVKWGGSLFIWKNYFGPSAKIIGIDFDPDAKKLEKYGFEIFSKINKFIIIIKINKKLKKFFK